jgi:hypothetical protein
MKTALAMLSVIFIITTADSQKQTPSLLIGAARCLAVKDYLPSSRVRSLSFGFLLDEKSYPGEKVLYVVNYKSPARSNGLVFAIFVTEHEGSKVFDIQNNASFVLSNSDPSGVDFVTPPLGGTWTQERLTSAIMQIEKQPRFSISVQDLSTLDPAIRCESYTDPQPNKVER